MPFWKLKRGDLRNKRTQMWSYLTKQKTHVLHGLYEVITQTKICSLKHDETHVLCYILRKLCERCRCESVSVHRVKTPGLSLEVSALHRPPARAAGVCV